MLQFSQKLRSYYMATSLPVHVMLCLLISLTGCVKGSADLQQRVEEIKARKGAPIQPLPVIKSYESFEYGASDLRDPFSPSRHDGEINAGNNGLSPDMSRPREALEAYPLDSLDMVGTLGKQSDTPNVLIKDKDGVIYQVKVGNYMGQNFGRITAIYEDHVELVELVPNGAGGWLERQASISLDN